MDYLPEYSEHQTGYALDIRVDATTYMYEHNITFEEYYAYFVENKF